MRIRRSPGASTASHPTPPTSNVVAGVQDRGICDESHGSVGSMEDEWDLASEEESISEALTAYVIRGANHRSGELILSGDEDSSYGGNAHGQVVPLENMFRTAADLSFPGTDSLPTDIDSLDVSVTRESAMTTSVRSRPVSTATTTYSDPVVAPESPKSWHVTKSHLLPLFIATTTITTLLSGYLAWERHSWRTHALSLEEELRRVRAELKKSQPESLLMECKEEKPLAGNSSEFDWEADECHAPAHKKIVLADNCWLRAEAALSFGACADHVQENAKNIWDTVASVGVSVWSAIASVPAKEVSYAEDFFNFSDGRPQTAGLTLHNVVDASASIAGATVAAGDAVMNVVNEVSSLLDDYVAMVVNATRDAIEDGSFMAHLD